MSERTLQLLQSLGYSAPPTTTASSNNIIDLRSSSSLTQETTSNESKGDDDTLEFLTTLLAESQAAAVETFGAGSLCVGNVSDDPDIEDVAVVIGSAGEGAGNTEGGSEEVKDAWKVLVDKLGLDLSDFTDPTITPLNISATDSSSLPAPLIKGSKPYNLLASLQDLRRVTVSSRDDSVLLVAWLGSRKGILLALLGVTETT